MGPESTFHDLVGQLDHPMAIVTTIANRVPAGCLVGFHSQCSISPARYALWLSKANHTYRVGVLAESFAVHFPDRDQMDLAELFGSRSGDHVDKFAYCRSDEGTAGVPILVDCPNRFVGRRVSWWDDGSDHVCLILEPIEVAAAVTAEPLRFADVAHLRAAHDAVERPLRSDERVATA